LAKQEKAMGKKVGKNARPVLKPGWWAAITLKPDTAPLRCYVGEIQALDSQGVRITLVDWFSAQPTGWDLFVPHANIESALVATNDNHIKTIRDEAGKWQERMEQRKGDNQ
jgi:hypothetical protein